MYSDIVIIFISIKGTCVEDHVVGILVVVVETLHMLVSWRPLDANDCGIRPFSLKDAA